jgi:four helix bundle protein
VNQFDHDKLDVYRVAISVLDVANRVITRIPRGYAYFKDQLGRASLSVVTNISEGAGEFMPSEKARFYRMACRSATECAAILDACGGVKLTDEANVAAGRDLLLRIVGMLIALSKRQLARAGKPTSVPIPEPEPAEGETSWESERHVRR